MPTVHEVLSGHVQVGDEIEVRGWTRRVRHTKSGVSFVPLTDGSCFDTLQIVAPNSLPNYEEVVKTLTAGCSITARGEVVESRGKQDVELRASEITLVGAVDDPETYPMAPKRHSMEHLREHAHLRPRTNLIGAVARVRHCLSQAVHRYFHENGFYWVHTPIITGSDAEGAGEMFRVSTLDAVNPPMTDGGEVDYSKDFFGKATNLTVSGQLNVECYCMALSKVYTFGPTFRAENSNTSRHLAEFWMIEPEIAFADLDDDAALAEDFLKYIFRAVLEERADDMAFFNERVGTRDCIARLEEFVSSEFVQMDYAEAVRVLEAASKKVKFEYPVSFGVDLQSEHERYLCEQHVGRPVVVKNYPKEIKAFYMRLNDDDRTVAAMDVLAPGIGEIIGGSQREERLDVLDARMIEAGLDPHEYGWYRDLRRYGTVPHAGFGLGFERTIAYATGVENVRDVIPFPRTPRHADF